MLKYCKIIKDFRIFQSQRNDHADSNEKQDKKGRFSKNYKEQQLHRKETGRFTQ